MATKYRLKSVTLKQGLAPMLLGMLREQPASGYALHKRFFTPVQPALTHIYRTLTEMNKQGFVIFERVPQDKTPDQKVYYVTELGITQLKKWLRQPKSPVMSYDMFLEQLLFSADLNNDEIANNITYYKKKIKHIRDNFDKIERARVGKLAASVGSPKVEICRNMAIDCIVAQFDGFLKWSDEALHLLSANDTSPKKAKRQKLSVHSK